MAVSSPAQANELLQAQGLLRDPRGGTSPERGAEIHDFVREHGFTNCLELGFASGAGSVYIASALEANGAGRLTCVDTPAAHEREPSARDTVDRAELAHRVELVYDEGGYTWFLHDTLRRQLRDGQRIEPLYDFVFLDGAHTWDVDGLAFELIDRLLKPGGYVLLDDLDWAVQDSWPVPDAQKEIAQVQDVWELLVLTDSRYDEFRTDGQWGWARKSESATPAVRTVVKRDLVAQVRELGRLVRRKLGRGH